MCFANWFKPNNQGDGGAGAALALAQQQQKDAAASIAAANLDTESSRSAAEQALRKAAASQGFASTIMGGGTGAPAATGFKQLFGQ